MLRRIMRASRAAQVFLMFGLAQIQPSWAQSCVTPEGCEIERRVQMEERFVNEKIDAFKEHRQTLLRYREDGDSYGFTIVVFRDGRVEFTGRSTVGERRSELATYPYLIPLSSVEQINELLRKYEFSEMPRRFGRRIGVLSHEIHFSLFVKTSSDSHEIVEVKSGTGYALPVGFQDLAGEIFRLSEVGKYSCSGIHSFAQCN